MISHIGANLIRALIGCTYDRMPLTIKTRRALNVAFDRRMPGLYKRLLLYRMTTQIDLALANPYPVRKASFLPISELDLSHAASDRPLVSIVIPVYGKRDYTSRCLASIQMLECTTAFEVIVVDDNSPDDTASFLAKISGLRVVTNQTNLGFVRSCNRGAAIARGEFIVFLNNDTTVLEGWLDGLIDTFMTHPDAGLAGSKLLYDNGAIQEAGGIIWSDGTGWNYGRDDKPGKPEYNYVREVDYCSGASIGVRKKLFEQIGGFDERYAPAYYEDTDLAFAVRKAGYRVLYQPASQVIHYEGITCGKDIDSGVKSYQVVNSSKFAEKWSATLAGHPSPIDIPSYKELDRFVKGRILIIDATTPTPDQDSGSVDSFYYQKILVDLGYKVVFAPENLMIHEPYTQDLLQLGVECLYVPYVSTLQAFLEEHGHEFDFVLLCRAWTAHEHFKDVKRYCPQAKVIFDTVDLHHLREEREAILTGSREMADQARKTKQVEFELMRSADSTIVLSEVEAKLLREQDPALRLVTIPLILDIHGCATSFDDRKDIVFLGGFQHPPNADAVEYFVKDIWPLIHVSIPDAKFFIVGSRMPERIKGLANSDGVVAVGFVQDLAEYFNRCRLSVVPLRYGAGIKGKIGKSASYGVPTVSTSIGTEGMGLIDGEQVLVADTAGSFAEKVIRLYSDRSLWEKLSQGALDFVTNEYSLQAGKNRLQSLLAGLIDSGQHR